jgi:hypothetical protein
MDMAVTQQLDLIVRGLHDIAFRLLELHCLTAALLKQN